MADDASNPPHDADPDDPAPFPDADSADGPIVICPHRSQAVGINPAPRGPFINCPHCGGQFAIHDDPGTNESDEQQREADYASREAELDGMRIRQLSTGRRAAIRAQGYLTVGLLGCASAIFACLFRAASQWRQRHAFSLYLVGLLIAIVPLLWLMVYFFRRWRDMGEELHKPLLRDPETPPDFSSLSDGSQQIEHLENLK